MSDPRVDAIRSVHEHSRASGWCANRILTHRVGNPTAKQLARNANNSGRILQTVHVRVTERWQDVRASQVDNRVDSLRTKPRQHTSDGIPRSSHNRRVTEPPAVSELDRAVLRPVSRETVIQSL